MSRPNYIILRQRTQSRTFAYMINSAPDLVWQDVGDLDPNYLQTLKAGGRVASSLIIFFLFFFSFSVPWSKMTILIEINNGQPIPLMWYIFILLFFGILALVNIAKILTTGPRL